MRTLLVLLLVLVLGAGAASGCARGPTEPRAEPVAVHTVTPQDCEIAHTLVSVVYARSEMGEQTLHGDTERAVQWMAARLCGYPDARPSLP